MKKEEIIPGSRDAAFRDRVINTHAGEKIPTCMQCGMCSGSCPVSHEMDFTPRQLVRMVHLGLKKDVLASNTIWICTTCFSCSVRCPRGIHPTELMEVLKQIAMEEGIKNRNAEFDNIFSNLLRKKGRISEITLITGYGLAEPGMIRKLPFGMSLMAKGKLPLSTDRMENIRELDAVFRIGEKTPEQEKENKGTVEKEGTEIKSTESENADGEDK